MMKTFIAFLGNATRYIVKAVGDLDFEVVMEGEKEDLETGDEAVEVVEQPRNKDVFSEAKPVDAKTEAAAFIRVPYSDHPTRWEVDAYDLDALSIGAGLLGVGGGGSTYISRLRTSHCLKNGQPIVIVKPEVMKAEADIVPIGFMGAPTVLVEKLINGKECFEAIDALKVACQVEKVHGLLCFEIGGMNAIEPLAVAAGLGVPVVDADMMGRAFPELQMLVPLQYGYSSMPAALADELGSAVICMKNRQGPKGLENMLRVHCSQFMG